MKILIIGGHGLLGQKLVQGCLASSDLEIFATVRRKATPVSGVHYCHLDITDPDEIQTVVDAIQPNAIIITAAMTQADECEGNHEICWKTNTESVKAFVTAANRLNAHLTYVSTDFVFNGQEEFLTEEAIPDPVNFYGKSKLAAEEWVKGYSHEWCIIRTVLVYGITSDMSRSNIILWVKKNLENRSPIRVVNDQWRTPTYAEDLAAGCLSAVRKKATGVFHISGKDRMSPYEIALRTAEFFSLDASLITPVPSSALIQPAQRPLKTGFDISKARAVLNYEPRSFDEGLRLMAAQLPDVT